MIQCIEDRGASCDSKCPRAFEGLPTEGVEDSRAAVDTNAAARHYGASSFSTTTLLQSVLASARRRAGGVNSSAQAAAHGAMSECEFFSLFYRDLFHPSDVGSLLLADMLIDHFVRAQAALDQNQPPRKQIASWSRDSANSAAATDVQNVPRNMQPMHPMSMITPVLRCLGALSVGDSSVGGVAEDEAQKFFPWQKSVSAMKVTRCNEVLNKKGSLQFTFETPSFFSP